MHDGKWIEFYQYDFSIGNKILKNYELIRRKTKPKDVDFDGVTMVPILTSAKH